MRAPGVGVCDCWAVVVPVYVVEAEAPGDALLVGNLLARW